MGVLRSVLDGGIPEGGRGPSQTSGPPVTRGSQDPSHPLDATLVRPLSERRPQYEHLSVEPPNGTLPFSEDPLLTSERHVHRSYRNQRLLPNTSITSATSKADVDLTPKGGPARRRQGATSHVG